MKKFHNIERNYKMNIYRIKNVQKRTTKKKIRRKKIYSLPDNRKSVYRISFSFGSFQRDMTPHYESVQPLQNPALTNEIKPNTEKRSNIKKNMLKKIK